MKNRDFIMLQDSKQATEKSHIYTKMQSFSTVDKYSTILKLKKGLNLDN